MGLIIGMGNGGATQAKPWYGISRDITSLDPEWTRVGSDMSLHQSLPIQSKIKSYIENADGSVNYWLNPGTHLQKADGSASDLSGADGNVMLYIPSYYFKQELNGNVLTKKFSEYALPGFIEVPEYRISPYWATENNVNNKAASVCSLQFNADGTIKRDAVTDLPLYTANAAQFRGASPNGAADDDLNISGLGRAMTNKTKAQFRALCTAAGGHFGAYRAMRSLVTLYQLEYANNNVQEAYNPNLTSEGYKQGGLGDGGYVSSSEWGAWNSYYPLAPNGVMASIGNGTGLADFVIKDWTAGGDKTIKVSSYRGMESVYQFLWMMCDDLLIYHQSDAAGGLSRAYLCDDASKFADPASDTVETAPDGYVLISSNLPRANGYYIREDITQHPDILPFRTGSGSSTTGLCDYFYRSGDGWFQALFFAAASASTYAGLRLLGTNYRATRAYAAFGFRFCR